MTSFRRLQSAPDDTFREEWNRLVRTVEQLLKLSAAAPLELSMISGSPHLSLSSAAPRTTERAQLSEALEIGSTATANMLHKSGESWITGDEITITDWGLEYPIPAGRKVIVDFHLQSKEWHVLTSQRIPFSPVVDVCCDDGTLVGVTHQLFVDGVINEEENPCSPELGGEDFSSVQMSSAEEEPPLFAE